MSRITIREALRDAIAEEMRADQGVFIMGEEVAEYQGAYKVTEGLLAEFGSRRVIDTPITEHGFAGVGIGASMAGLRPIVEFMTFNFAMQAIDQIINSAGKTHYMSGGQVSCPIVFRGPNGAAASVGAQHSQCYASWYSHCPGLKVIAPYTASDHKGLLKAAIRDNSPVVFLESELLYGQSFDITPGIGEPVEIGTSHVLRHGSDCTIVSYSYILNFVLEAADVLDSQYGISCEVVDLRTLRPLDTSKFLESVQKTGRLVCVEEGWEFAGVAAEICSITAQESFDYLDSPPLRVCAMDVPLPYSKVLEQRCLPNVERIVEAVLKSCNATANLAR